MPHKVIEVETLIIGAGPAGLASAMELDKAGKEFAVIEKQASVGGLAKTYTFAEPDGSVFLTDNGPHRFFSKNPYLYEFIEELLHEQWITVNRSTRQFIEGKFYDYPINPVQVFRNLGVARSARALTDFLISQVRYTVLRKPVVSFEDFVLSKFGRTIGDLNMINYTEKIWGIPASTIHPDWGAQRIKGLSVGALAKDAAKRLLSIKGTAKPKTLVDTFYYPELGTGLIYETIHQQIAKRHQVFLSTEPTRIRHENGRITSVIAEGPDGTTEFRFENLIESVPVTRFIKLLDPLPPQRVLDAGKTLRHRSQVYVFITLDKESVSNDQWIYFPDKETPIARISEMRNFSTKMAPEGKTSLFVEIFCFEDDATWNRSDDELMELVMSELEEPGFITREEVRHSYVIRAKDVYPVYDLAYRQYLAVVQEYLDAFDNLYYIGRPGRFRYNNQDHSLEMGIVAAKSIIDGVRHDIESVGTEQSYFESGAIPTREKPPVA